jgi:hypothetical protein
MHEVVAIRETKPMDGMESAFVTLPYAAWAVLQTTARQATALAEELSEEKARSAAVISDFEAYMREHQVLMAQQKQERR